MHGEFKEEINFLFSYASNFGMDDLHTTTSSGAPAVPAAASPASTPSRLDRQQLQDHRLPAVHECFYVPNFVTEEQAQTLLRAIYAAPKPKWRVLAHRRLQYWGGLPTDKGPFMELLWILIVSEPKVCFFFFILASCQVWWSSRCQTG